MHLPLLSNLSFDCFDMRVELSLSGSSHEDDCMVLALWEFMQVVYDRVTDRSRGFAFVTMGSVEEANEAIRLFDGSVSHWFIL